MSQRQNAFPYIENDTFYFLKKRKGAYQIVEQNGNSYETKKYDIQMHGGKKFSDGIHIGTCFFKKTFENRELEHEGYSGNQNNT